MKITDESQILEEVFRGVVIKEIEGAATKERKAKVYKEFELLKDKTQKHVLKKIKVEMTDKNGVVSKNYHKMADRCPNISILRKIIDKKASVYKDGAARTTQKKDQENLDKLIDLLNFNTKMKKTNKYTELSKNSEVFILPYMNKREKKFGLIMKALLPFQYDVLEDKENQEVGLVYILSDFTPSSATLFSGKEYIWWSDSYHFTTNGTGKIISGEDKIENPIKELPCYSFSMTQDGVYWDDSGDDLVENSILINLLLADLYYIAKFQGMGVFYMTGKGMPEEVDVGPAAKISLEVREGEPDPKIGFASPNAPISDHITMIESLLHFLMFTNNLSYEPSGESAGSVTSGIHDVIRKSENIDDITDQQEMYRDGEPELLRKAILWMNLYNKKNLLSKKWKPLGQMNPEMDIALSFPEPKVYASEKEKLEVIKERLLIGLDTMLEAIKKDNPDLTDKEAKIKLGDILKARAEKARADMKEFNDGQQDNSNNKNSEGVPPTGKKGDTK